MLWRSQVIHEFDIAFLCYVKFLETLRKVTLECAEHTFCQRENLVASVWMGKKTVNMLSTLAKAEDIHTAQETEQQYQSPCAVYWYGSTV